MTVSPAAPRRSRMAQQLRHGALIAVVALMCLAGNTRFSSSPRGDGAGYAVLGEALRAGQGYREVDNPDQPLHAHYPPGYPLTLAALWSVTGRSVAAAHVLSFVCTLGAILAAWCWFRTLYPPRAALALGLALALNWTWGRVGGSIQTEPLFLLLGQGALLLTSWTARRGGLVGVGRGLVLGMLLAACVLTRHVGVSLALAIGLDLWMRNRRGAALAAALTAGALIVPWVIWLATVQHNTQLALLAQTGLGARVAGNALFYMRRLPDALTGPFVEVGTVFRRSTLVGAACTAWAAVISMVMVVGWGRTLRIPSRRLAGMVPLATLALLMVWPFTEAGRFLIPLVPCLLVGAVGGLAAMGAIAGVRRPRKWALAIVVSAAIPYSAYRIATDRVGAEVREYASFEAACAWIARQPAPEGPVLSRQPGAVYWLTGRHSLTVNSDDPEAIAALVERYGVAFLIVDRAPYAGALESPGERFVASHPELVALVWGKPDGGRVSVYAVVRNGGSAQRLGPSKVNLP